MPELAMHPIMAASFALIDQEIGTHPWADDAYAVVRRVIHSTADFEFATLLHLSPDAIAGAIAALQAGVPILTDVTMVKQGIQSTVARTFQNPVYAAIDFAAGVTATGSGETRTASGLRQAYAQHPGSVVVIGNAPTALLALCELGRSPGLTPPALVIGAPVGFVGVLESKQALAAWAVPQIRIAGRKGGSPAAAAIVNALLTLAWAQI